MIWQKHDLIGIGETVVRALLGQPNEQLSKPDQLRWGTNGSKWYSIPDGRFYDHEEGTGGNLITVIRRYGDGRPVHEQLDTFGATRLVEKAEVPIKIVKDLIIEYRYCQADGEIAYIVKRTDLAAGGKKFAQRAPGHSKRKDELDLPYRLPEIKQRYADPIFIAEGEKCVHAIEKATGCLATTNSGGASNWKPILNEHFIDRDIVIVEDNDEAGRNRTDKLVEQLTDFANTIKIIRFTGEDDKYDVADYLVKHSGEQLLNRIKGLDEVDDLPTYPVLDIHQLWQMPPPQWIVDDIVPESELMIVFGAPGQGKTFVALDLSLHIAAGRQWYEHAVKQGAVLYVAGEGVAGLPNRIKAWHAYYGYEPVEDIFILPQTVGLLEPGNTQKLINTIKQMDRTFKMIVIDTVARSLVGGDENTSKDMGTFIAACERVQRELSVCVMGIHHTGKVVAKGMRGSSALLGAVNTSLSCKLIDSDQIQVSVEKQKDIEKGAPMHFDMVPVTFGEGILGESSVALSMASIVKSKKNKVELTTNDRLVLKALNRAEGARSEAVTFKHWRDATGLIIDTSNKGGYTTFKRAVTRLIDRDVVEKTGEHYWCVR